MAKLERRNKQIMELVNSNRNEFIIGQTQHPEEIAMRRDRPPPQYHEIEQSWNDANQTWGVDGQFYE